jgi:ribosome-associated heat shock protein Hsp15
VDKLRLDKWLWAARFYKKRSMATEAINGGHVHLNGQRIKPSRIVNVGDEVTITKSPYTFVVHVKALSDKRGAATLAQQLYEETIDSQEKRDMLRQQLRLQAAANPSPRKRPDKQQRRRIIRFKNINEV